MTVIIIKQLSTVLNQQLTLAYPLFLTDICVTYVCLLSGNIDYKVVPMSPLLDPAHCSQGAQWSVGFPGAVCDQTVNFHRLAFNNPSPSSLNGKDVMLTNSFGIKTQKLIFLVLLLKKQ